MTDNFNDILGLLINIPGKDTIDFCNNTLGLEFIRSRVGSFNDILNIFDDKYYFHKTESFDFCKNVIGTELIQSMIGNNFNNIETLLKMIPYEDRADFCTKILGIDFIKSRTGYDSSLLTKLLDYIPLLTSEDPMLHSSPLFNEDLLREVTLAQSFFEINDVFTEHEIGKKVTWLQCNRSSKIVLEVIDALNNCKNLFSNQTIDLLKQLAQDNDPQNDSIKIQLQTKLSPLFDKNNATDPLPLIEIINHIDTLSKQSDLSLKNTTPSKPSH